METFNLKLKALRKENGKTQQNIADLLGVRRSTYGEYERGKIFPPMDKIKVLADYFGVSIDYLINNAKKAETMDVSENLKLALTQLRKNKDLNFDGHLLDDETRKLLISSLENGLRMAEIIKKGKDLQ